MPYHTTAHPTTLHCTLTSLHNTTLYSYTTLPNHTTITYHTPTYQYQFYYAMERSTIKRRSIWNWRGLYGSRELSYALKGTLKCRLLRRFSRRKSRSSVRRATHWRATNWMWCATTSTDCSLCTPSSRLTTCCLRYCGVRHKLTRARERCANNSGGMVSWSVGCCCLRSGWLGGCRACRMGWGGGVWWNSFGVQLVGWCSPQADWPRTWVRSVWIWWYWTRGAARWLMLASCGRRL